MAEHEELLDYEEQDEGQSTDATIRRIKVSALGRYEICIDRPKNSKVLLKARYVSRQLEVAHPMRMLHEVVKAQLLPSLADVLPDHQLVWSYDQQLKPIVINARQVLTVASTVPQLEQQLANGTCNCQLFAPQYMVAITDSGIQQHCPAAYGTCHVLTTDLQLVQHAPLQALLAQGLNHIPLAPMDASAIVEVNCSVAQQFFDGVVTPTALSQVCSGRSFVQ